MAYYVYILQSLKDHKYYIGSTSDVVKRVAFHNAARQRSTRSRVPFALVYQEQFLSKSDALKRELFLKSLKGGQSFKKIIAP